MIHILTDGIQLNPIDSWIVLFIKYGAGWASVAVAIWALLRPVKQLYYGFIYGKLQMADSTFAGVHPRTSAKKHYLYLSLLDKEKPLEDRISAAEGCQEIDKEEHERISKLKDKYRDKFINSL